MDISIHYMVSILLMMTGLYTVVVKKNLIKIIIGIAILMHGVNLFFIASGYTIGGTAPIMTPGEVVAQVPLANPLPQGLIVITLRLFPVLMALMAATAFRIYQYYGTFNLEKIKELKE